ncbi:hypothetical protein KKF84_21310 [Myxococcota bacterium]|nr:hypothetical protein [Myxococcota bacterium]MBU1537865.1 hypothetical protein [Myxococcota bacterium]
MHRPPPSTDSSMGHYYWNPEYLNCCRAHTAAGSVALGGRILAPGVIDAPAIPGISRGLVPEGYGPPHFQVTPEECALWGADSLLREWSRLEQNAQWVDIWEALPFSRGIAALDSFDRPLALVALAIGLRGQHGREWLDAPQFEDCRDPAFMVLLLKARRFIFLDRQGAQVRFRRWRSVLKAREPLEAAELLIRLEEDTGGARRLLDDPGSVDVCEPWRWASVYMRLFNEPSGVREMSGRLIAQGGTEAVAGVSMLYHTLFQVEEGKALLTDLIKKKNDPRLLVEAAWEFLRYLGEPQMAVALARQAFRMRHASGPIRLSILRLMEEAQGNTDEARELAVSFAAQATMTLEYIPLIRFLGNVDPLADDFTQRAEALASESPELRELAVAVMDLDKEKGLDLLHRAERMSNTFRERVSLINVLGRHGGQREKALAMADDLSKLATSVRDWLALLHEIYLLDAFPADERWGLFARGALGAVADYDEGELVVMTLFEYGDEENCHRGLWAMERLVRTPPNIASFAELLDNWGFRERAIAYLVERMPQASTFDAFQAIFESLLVLDGGEAIASQALEGMEKSARTRSQMRLVNQWRRCLGPL